MRTGQLGHWPLKIWSTMLLLSLLLATIPPVFGETEINLASVSPEYTPTAGPGLPDPVSMEGFSFEVNQETGRARIVVEYTYPDQPVFGMDGGLGPEPTIAQIPGLIYDPISKTVVYQASGRRTVCAIAHKRRFLLWQRSTMEPTGVCVVSTRLGNHTEDDGWSVHRFRAIDTIFKIR